MADRYTHDAELRLLFCVLSSLPYRVLLRAQVLLLEPHEDSLAVLTLMRGALNHIIRDLDTDEPNAQHTYAYGNNDVEAFRRRRDATIARIDALRVETREASQCEEYLEAATVISEDGLANALVRAQLNLPTS